MATYSEICTLKNQHKETFLSKQNVIGIGTGYKNSQGKVSGDLSVVTLVTRKLPKAELMESDLVPAEVDGIKTDVIEIGHVQVLNERIRRMRPAQPGVSLGHYEVTSGTFGCLVSDNQSGKRLILSNNHVLANSNKAKIGDAIIQPGSMHGGKKETDMLARLFKFQQIKYGLEQDPPTTLSKLTQLLNKIAEFLNSKQKLKVIRTNPTAFNTIDAALAQPIDQNDILAEILEIGKVKGKTRPSLGMRVIKSGKTTGLTQGSITVLDVTIDVDYREGNIARFEQQILTTAMSLGGDSGSLLLEKDTNKAVGLLFAGSNQASIHNPIDFVLDTMDIQLVMNE